MNHTLQQAEAVKVAQSKEDFQYAIEIGQIKAVMVDLISKLQVALCFPNLAEMSGDSLRDLFLNEEEISEVKRLLKEAHHKQGETFVEDLSEPSLEIGIDQVINTYSIKYQGNVKRSNEDICNLLYSLLDNKNVIKYCREKSKVSDQGYDFIVHIQALLDIILTKLEQGPEVVESNEIKLHQMFQYNEKAEDRYHNTKEELIIQSKANKAILKKCDDKLRSIIDRIDDVYNASKELIRKCSDEANYTMNWAWKLSEFKQDELEEMAKSVEATFDKLKKDNIDSEKQLRVTRYKVEQQLRSAIAKYDADMEERQDQYDSIREVFEKEQEALQSFSEKYYEQQETYLILMKEKEEYEKRIWDQKLYLIQSKIAARKIQRYFRAFLFLVKEYGNTKKKKK